MFKSLIPARSFWTSKLGQAAFASIAAMCVMIVFTTQFDVNEAHAASFAGPSADGIELVEIA